MDYRGRQRMAVRLLRLRARTIHASFAIIRSLHPGFDGSFRERETDLNVSRVPVEIRRSLAASNFFLVSRKNRTFALFPRPVHMELRNCFFFFFFCSVVARASWLCRFIKFLYVFLSRLSRSTFSFFFSFSRPTCETSEKKLSSLRRVPNKASKINARNQPRLRRVPAREKIMVVILNRRSRRKTRGKTRISNGVRGNLDERNVTSK